MRTPAFIWYELMTTDAPAAVAFYTTMVGWGSQSVGGAHGDYTVLTLPAGGVAGVMAAFEGGPPPVWMGYVAVDDVDAFADRLTMLGGAVHKPPQDIPGVGRFAVVADPQGAVFMLFKPDGPAGALASGGRDVQGLFGWRELLATDASAAFDFYARLFGWTRGEAFDMGPMGSYQLFRAGGEEPHGGMMNRPPETPRPFWAFYIQVDAAEAAAGRAVAAGGKVLMGPQQTPTGEWIVQGLDPQGALFCLLSLKP